MSKRNQMNLVAYPYSGQNSQAWRLPEVNSGDALNFDYFARYAKTAERGLFDSLFLPDNYGVMPNPPQNWVSSSSTFEPLTLMAGLAAVTKHIGLTYTASSTYNEPHLLARQLASLDHISGGRAGWNVVTSSNAAVAENYTLRTHPSRTDRYRRAHEVYDVVTGLWDSFEDDAFTQDKASGEYFAADKLHSLDHKGEFHSVKGPLSIARPVQGYPVIAQAGGSDEGIDLGGRIADVIFSSNLTPEYGRDFRRSIRDAAARHGRNPDHVKVLTGVGVIWGESDAHAQDRFAALAALFREDAEVAKFARTLGVDPDLHDLDAPLASNDLGSPEHLGVGHNRALRDWALRENLSVRQIAQKLILSNNHRGLQGSTKTIADNFEEWFATGAADGFVVMSPYMLGGFELIVEHVVPELQRRGLFRTAYEGRTLRENLGLPRPTSRYASAARQAAE